MNQASWTDTNFYFITEHMQYTIRGETVLDEPVDPEILQRAADTAFRRFPYFSIRLILHNNEYLLIPNLLPHIVLSGNERVVLGSPDVNYHLAVISCYDDRIVFHFSHCITDGIGRMPLTKSVLYYYLKEKKGIDLDPAGIWLADSELFPDEIGEPLPVRTILKTEPVDLCRIGDAYKPGSIFGSRKKERREFRFHVEENAFMDLCRSFCATPNVLASVLLARASWKLCPQNRKDVVTGLCVNMRPALQNQHSHLLLLADVPLSFPVSMKDQEMETLCAETRKGIDRQRQTEYIRCLCKKNILEFDRIQKIRTLEQRKKIARAFVHGPEGFLSVSYILSYVGRSDLGSLFPYIKAMYTSVDAVPDDGAIIEITTADHKFFFTVLQDFPEDDYIGELIQMLRSFGLAVSEPESGPVMTPLITLP